MPNKPLCVALAAIVLSCASLGFAQAPARLCRRRGETQSVHRLAALPQRRHRRAGSEGPLPYWAKEASFEGEAEHMLNYDIRVLGLHGFLSLNAVAGMPELG